VLRLRRPARHETDAEAPRTGARSTVQPTTNMQRVESSASSARLWRVARKITLTETIVGVARQAGVDWREG
jgi:hypothetical protein